MSKQQESSTRRADSGRSGVNRSPSKADPLCPRTHPKTADDPWRGHSGWQVVADFESTPTPMRRLPTRWCAELTRLATVTDRSLTKGKRSVTSGPKRRPMRSPCRPQAALVRTPSGRCWLQQPGDAGHAHHSSRPTCGNLVLSPRRTVEGRAAVDAANCGHLPGTCGARAQISVERLVGDPQVDVARDSLPAPHTRR